MLLSTRGESDLVGTGKAIALINLLLLLGRRLSPQTGGFRVSGQAVASIIGQLETGLRI
jgi:hypothetical protein